MVAHQGFLSFFICSSRFLSELWSVKLYSKINMVFNTCLFWGVQVFFILHSEVQSFLPYLLRWCCVILGNFSSCFSIHMLSRMRYFKCINLFVWVILCHIPLKAFPKECYYCGAYQWSKLSLYHLGGRSFHLFVDLKQAIVSVSGRLSPHNFEMFSISPLQAYSFCCWFFPTTLL